MLTILGLIMNKIMPKETKETKRKKIYMYLYIFKNFSIYIYVRKGEVVCLVKRSAKAQRYVIGLQRKTK